MIQIRNASLEFGNQTLFDEINLTISETDRIGLIGLNGSGKSTLLKAIAGQLRLDSGIITIIGSKKFAYLPQQVVLESNKSILDEGYAAHKEIWPLEHERRILEQRINNNDLPEDAQAGARLAEVTEQLHDLDAHQAFVETKKTLNGLGFTDKQLTEPVSTLSVGWKMRLVLCKLLLQKADFYLFDEPTNHLDIVAKDWFLSFLEEASFGYLLVCHERYFLNKVCSEIIELEFGKAIRFQGDYTDYEVQKEHNLQELVQKAKLQQKEISRKKATIQRFRAKANKAKMAKSMEKALNKIDLIELPPSAKRINVNLPSPTQRSGKTVLTIKQVAHTFDNKKIFENASFTIHRGQRVALIAANGVGKTTLFNIITGHYPVQTGMIEFGHNVDHTIFHQDQDKWLNKKNTILDEVMATAPAHKTPEQARTLLGCFLFSGQDIKKKISVLSGGEKNRVSMVKVLLQDANFLLLDEPTNHLDIPSKDILLKALNGYQGTLLFVSHDHDFIDQLANHVIALDTNGTKAYHGNYTDYKNQIAAFSNKSNIAEGFRVANTSSAKTKPTKGHGELYQLRKTAGKFERKIAQLEKNIEKAQHVFLDLEYGTQAFEIQNKELQDLQSQLEATFSEWETIVKQLES